jgi:hypothetical protein
MIGSPLQQLLVLLVCSASGGLACPSFQLGWRTSGKEKSNYGPFLKCAGNRNGSFWQQSKIQNSNLGSSSSTNTYRILES